MKLIWRTFVMHRFAVVLGLMVWGNTVTAQEAATPAGTGPGHVFSIPSGHYDGPLTISPIVRYRRLPQRMDLEPVVLQASTEESIDDRETKLLDRMLRESSDSELLQVSALSLARIARAIDKDISGSHDILRQHVAENPEQRVRLACAVALVESDCRDAATEFLVVAAGTDEAFVSLVDPALAKWEIADAKPIWLERLNDQNGPAISGAAFRSACEGLTALNAREALPRFLEIVNNEPLDFSKRSSAAKSVGTLDSAMGITLASTLSAGDERDRLLAAICLSGPDPVSQKALAAMCTDPADSVAAIAWRTLLETAPELLVPHLEIGRSHRDALIRLASAETMFRFINPDYCGWLGDLTGDINIEVRNRARVLLVDAAGQSAELSERVISDASGCIRNPERNWESLEQALVILGQLKAGQFSPDVLPLLYHERPEVMVTAAWLLHLYPDVTIADQAVALIPDRQQQIRDRRYEGRQQEADLGIQMAFLFQLAGLTGIRTHQEIMEVSFEKGEVGGVEKRAAAMWSLGLLYVDVDDSPLIKQFEGRLNDRNPFQPELDPVRQKALLALGFTHATSTVRSVRRGLSDDPFSLVPSTAYIVLPHLGEEQPETPQLHFTIEYGVGRINPIAVE
ncbi:MAG: hypothetical protein KDA96_03530 [Planctomycetaceae bacterium]|nr:hypothetical protein [Planctomycetaceae bacterium]